MTKYFVDTYFFAALLNPRDSGHSRTKTLLARLLKQSVQLVTTGFVLLELGNALSSSPARYVFAEFLASIKEMKVELIPASQRLLIRGIHLYCDREDKEWSVVDCISFIVMKQQRIRIALTLDHHFEQAGFQRLFE